MLGRDRLFGKKRDSGSLAGGLPAKQQVGRGFRRGSRFQARRRLFSGNSFDISGRRAGGFANTIFRTIFGCERLGFFGPNGAYFFISGGSGWDSPWNSSLGCLAGIPPGSGRQWGPFLCCSFEGRVGSWAASRFLEGNKAFPARAFGSECAGERQIAGRFLAGGGGGGGGEPQRPGPG